MFMRVSPCVFVCLLLATACDSPTTTPPGVDGGDRPPLPDAGPPCEPSGGAETMCSDGRDDDCNGFVDCLDPACEGASCGGELTCTAGACLMPCEEGAEGCLPPLGRIDNLRPTVRGDTAIIEFGAVEGARDYRIYPYPEGGNILVGANGETVIEDAIYRCAGDRPRSHRSSDGINRLDLSYVNNVHDYQRSESEAILGYVYLTPAEGRRPVYRVADPNVRANYTWEYEEVPASEYNGARYVDDPAERDALLAQRWRDDGIAFYVPETGTRTIHHMTYDDGWMVIYPDGPEADARSGDSDGTAGPTFSVHATQVEGSVPLYRIHYSWAREHDVLAAGNANRDIVLYQGNQPLTSLTWPALRGRTTLVIEALDTGCPFPDAYVGPQNRPEGDAAFRTITLDEARLPSGEVFINGQHDAANRPRAIARAFVTVDPVPHEEMDWYQHFDPEDELAPFTTMYEDGNRYHILHNDILSLEYFQAGPGDNSPYGAMLGQFVMGSSASFMLVARDANARLESDRFLHVTMSVDIGSTGRRYPQIFITTAPVDPPSFEGGQPLLMSERFGPRTFEGGGPGEYDTIIVQPFTFSPQLQIELCDQRGWGVSDQCPHANIYGFSAGTTEVDWEEPWLPVPTLGDLVGHDRPVRFDVYASTERVYVFVEGRPAGCANLPEGRMSGGDVSVAFGAAAYHIDIDAFVVEENAQHQFWRRTQVMHTERRFDDLGVDSDVDEPAWDESYIPCASRWYAPSF